MIFLISVVLTITFFLVGQFIGYSRAIFILLLITIFFWPISLNSAAYGSHSGVAPFEVSISTYGVVLLGILGASLLYENYRRWPILLTLPLVFLAIGVIFIWPHEINVVSGAINYGLGYIAVIAGMHLWRRLILQPDGREFVGKVLLTFLIIEFGVVLAQLVGLTLPYYGGTSMAGSVLRPSGTFGHPGNLGKILVLAMLLVLPMTKAPVRKVRNVAVCSVALCLLIVAISYSRANIVAALLVLVAWLAFDGMRVRSLGRNLLVVAGVSVASLPFMGTFFQRFQDDPTGGERPELTAEAIEQIGKTTWEGVGPNNYVEVVGVFGSATAAGFPVHNIWLLIVAECGIPVAMALFVPFLAWVKDALKSARSSGPSFLASRSILVSLPALFVIGYTGYGLLSNEVWVFLGFVVGCLWQDVKLRNAKLDHSVRHLQVDSVKTGS